MAPGPTPTLTTSAPASIRSRVPSAVTTLPATTGAEPATDAHGPHRLDRLLLVAVRGVDDEHVDPAREQAPRLAGDVAVDADGGRGQQLAGRVHAPGRRAPSAARPCG